jgi:hypothetical protein
VPNAQNDPHCAKEGFSSFYQSSSVFIFRCQPGAITVKTSEQFGPILILGSTESQWGGKGYAGQQQVGRTECYPPLFCGVDARFMPVISII